MMDGAQLRALVEQEKPHLVVPQIEAIATGLLEQIEQEGLARVIPTAPARLRHGYDVAASTSANSNSTPHARLAGGCQPEHRALAR